YPGDGVPTIAYTYLKPYTKWSSSRNGRYAYGYEVKPTYYERDRHMVHEATMVMGLWNGQPGRNGGLGGPRYTGQCAKDAGRQWWLLTVGRTKARRGEAA